VAKVTAPLLSFGASGAIAQTQVYAKWKGRSYVRRHVIPSNPQTAEQTLTRNSFTWLSNVYKVAPSLVTDVWTAYARGLTMTNRNAWVKKNLPDIRTATDLNTFTMSPGALGGLPPASCVVTPGNDQLSMAIAAPAVSPTGWTVTSAIAAVIPDQNPQSAILYNISAGEDLTAAYVVLLTGLLNAQLYQVFAWLKWLRPDGLVAYSPSIQTTGLTT